MGKPAARHSDLVIGTCPCHSRRKSYTAVWVAATSVYADGRPRVNGTSMAISNCGHVVVPLVTSSSVKIEGSGAVRAGDLAQNCGLGTTVTGSPTVFTGD